MVHIPDRDSSGKSITTTEFEADKGDFKAACHKSSTVSGTATIEVKIPGTPGTTGRLIFRGDAWFIGTSHPDDLCKVEIVDIDGIAAPPGTVVETFYDTDVPAGQQGHWFIDGFISLGGIAGYGELPAGFYMRSIGITGDARADTLHCNISWLKPK